MPPLVILVSSIGIELADGATTGRRIRINRPGDANARCKASRASGQHKDFSPFMRQPTPRSIFNAISFQHVRTEASGPRPCRRGAKSSPSRDFICGFRQSHFQFSRQSPEEDLQALTEDDGSAEPAPRACSIIWWATSVRPRQISGQTESH